MKILDRLSFLNLKLNKKRTIGTIAGIILSVALITAVAGMFTSLHATLVANTIEETGYYHYILPGLDKETLELVENNRQVKDIIKVYSLGTAMLDTSSDQSTYLNVFSLDRFDDLPYVITKGQKPKNSSEVIIPESLASDASIKIGDTLSIDVGRRMTKDGYPLDASNPGLPDEEVIANPEHKTYKITGFYKKPGSKVYYYNNNQQSSFYTIVTTHESSSSIDAYVALSNPRERDTFVKSLYATEKFESPTNKGDNLYAIATNYELLRWEVFAFSDETIQMLYAVVGIVILIIISTSIFCIRNSFAISTTEKSKMFGMLSSVGATKKQIKKSVITEAFMQGIIGIPIGILSGIFADFVLVRLVNVILKDALFENIGGLVFKMSLPACLLAIVLGSITIYFSALSSARRASRVCPIDNIRNAKDISLTAKNMKTPVLIKKTFKTGGVLAFKNLKRSKKKYRTTVVALAVSILVFISMNTFLGETFKMASDYYTEFDYNLMIIEPRQLTAADLEKIREIETVNKAYVTYDLRTNQNDYIVIRDLSKIAEIKGDTLICEKYEEGTNNCIGEQSMWLELVALDDATFRNYVAKLGLDYDQVKEKGILADDIQYTDESGKEHITRRYKYQTGDTIKGTFHEEDFSLEIATVTDIRPYGLEKYNYWGGFLIVDKSYFEEIAFSPFRISIESNDPDKLETELSTMFKGLRISNIDKDNRHSRAINLVVSIFLYGFITVIALIGVTSIFNTITSNMELRGKEFAMLKSIGMTKREFSRMINLETIFYSMKSLLWGITLGLVGSYAIHRAVGLKESTPFVFPTTAIILSIIFVFVLVFIIMHFSITKINKQNTIETIRKDNI